MGLIKDDTEIFVRQGEGFKVLAHGNWYQDDVLSLYAILFSKVGEKMTVGENIRRIRKEK